MNQLRFVWFGLAINTRLRVPIISASVVLIFNAVTAVPSLADTKLQTAADACMIDLEALPNYLARNDAGVHDNANRPEVMNAVARFAEAAREGVVIATDAGCTELIRNLLAHYRPSHLGVVDMPAGMRDAPAASPGVLAVASRDPLEPRVEILSERTALIVLPSFDPSYQAHIERLLRRYGPALRRRPAWIVDVRGNDGGSDWVWRPLFAQFAPTTLAAFNLEFLATAENIVANEYVMEFGLINTSQVRRFAEAITAAMREGVSGQYVQSDNRGPKERMSLIAMPRARKGGRVVGILADHLCASACEQFVMDSRQSWQIKVFGQRTSGALDYSNLRPWRLPSGRRVLWYAISRSQRLPEHGIDGWGLAPDYPLPAPTNVNDRASEVGVVKSIIETVR